MIIGGLSLAGRRESSSKPTSENLCLSQGSSSSKRLALMEAQLPRPCVTRCRLRIVTAPERERALSFILTASSCCSPEQTNVFTVCFTRASPHVHVALQGLTLPRIRTAGGGLLSILTVIPQLPRWR